MWDKMSDAQNHMDELRPVFQDRAFNVHDTVALFDDPGIIPVLMQLGLESSEDYGWRAFWAIGHMTSFERQTLKTYIPALLDKLDRHEGRPGYKREILKILIRFHHEDFADTQYARLIDVCMGFLESTKEQASLRMYSLRILSEACKLYPELIPEVILTCGMVIPTMSAGLKHSCKKTLKEIENIEYH